VHPAQIVDLGVREYGQCWELQRRLVTQRQQGEIGDLILLVEHPHVFTVGRAARGAANLLAPGEVPVFDIERGGDVTYHGPGQLVGYPILLLREGERDLHRYLRGLEYALIATAANFGLTGTRRPGLTGMWVGDHKLASIGVAVKRWVTLHGFALNVTTDLAYFNRINPCGLPSAVMSSLQASGGRDVDMASTKHALARALAPALNRQLSDADATTLGF
jgi:lipoate-protein ligase B